MKLKGKVAMITGAGRNIGRAIALAMAREGADLALVTRKNNEGIHAVAAEVRALGARALPLLADITDAPAMAEAMRKAGDEFGKVDILVNNAVQRVPVKLSEMTLEQWHDLLHINLTGAFIATRAVIPGMKSRGWGRIVNFSGISALTGGGMAVPKAGVIGLTRCLARELGGDNITVNAIAPGSVEVERANQERDFLSHNLALQFDRACIKRAGRPEEVGALVAFLCTEDAGFITGQIISINGGAAM